MKHSAVTGPSLHDLKGADSATDDFVLTASSGASVWKYATPINCDGTLEPFSNAILHIRHQTSSGTGGGNGPVSTAWTTRPLNTVVTNLITSASLSTNQISLPSGTYVIKGHSGGSSNGTGWSQNLRLRDVTNNITKLVGLNTQTTLALFRNTSFIEGRFVLTGTSSLELQHWIKSPGTPTTNDWGTPLSTGEVEVYADIMIWKIA